jgi:hypothetical protein
LKDPDLQKVSQALLRAAEKAKLMGRHRNCFQKVYQLKINPKPTLFDHTL